MISFTLVNICKIINKFKKLPSISLDTWFFLPCVCRRKHFTLPLTRFYFSVPLISNLSFCPVSLKPSSLPLPVEIFFTTECLSYSLTPMSDQDRISHPQINTISNIQAMRIKKNILLIISWFIIKFTEKFCYRQ